MKDILLSIIILGSFIHSRAQTATGSIRGNIQNSKHELLSGITVGLYNTRHHAVTNDDGSYELRNVVAGSYTLTLSGIGYMLSKENVVIKAGKVTTVDLQLNEDTKQLEPVTVRATPARRYVTTSSTSGLRLPLDINETPQSIQVISHQLILDQQAQNLNDVTKDMVGVINNNSYSSFTMRGFSSLGATYSNNFIVYDGMLGNMYYWQQTPFLYNIDRVENIGGPAAALYSVGTPGGVINMVTKKPLDHPSYSFNLTTGSWGLIDASADLGGPLTTDHKWQYRLNIGYNNQNSIYRYQYAGNLFLAPSLAYHFDKHTDLTIDYVRNDQNTRSFEFWGGALLMKPDSTYDWKHVLRTSAFYSPADHAASHENSLTLTFNHIFSDRFKLTYIGRYTHSELASDGISATFYSGTNYFMSYPDSVPRQYTIFNDQSYNFINSLFTTETFGKKAFKQTLLTGIDLQAYGSKDLYIQGRAHSVSFLHPDYSQDNFAPYQDPNAFVEDNKNATIQFGPYVEDLIAIGEHVKVLVAGRYETFNWILRPNGPDNYTKANDSSTASVFIPRAGFVYSFTKNQSAYASYSRSYQPQYDNSRNNGGPFPPQIGEQEEIGYKGLWLDGELMTGLALYNIRWENILAPDPNDPTGQREIVVPGLSSRGAELTLQGNLKDWSISASYAYNNEAFALNSPLGSKGDLYDNAPHHIADLWIKHAFGENSRLKRLSLSLGGKYVSDRIGSTLSAPKFLMPAYFVMDAGVGYQVRRFDIALNGYNITNTTYIPGWYASDFAVMPGNPVNWKLSVRYSIK